MAIQLRRGDYNDFDPSRLLDGELAVVLENDPDTEDGTGLYACFGEDDVKRLAFADEAADVPIATTTTAGIVKPDGTTITVDSDGTIHGAEGYEGAPLYCANSGTWFGSTCNITTDESFELAKGVVLVIVFSSLPRTSSNRQASARINVNSTGERYIQQSDGNLRCIDIPYRVATAFVYNGTKWEIAGDIDRACNKVLTATSDTAAYNYQKALDIKTYYTFGAGMMIVALFDYANTAELSALCLGVVTNATSSAPQYSYAPIRKNGAVLTEADNLKAGVPYLFRYDGMNWDLIGALGSSVTPSSTAPLVDGTASAGSSTDYARADHVHPTDTSRASASDLTAHTSDTVAHVTQAERTAWDAKYDAEVATTDEIGLVKPDNETLTVDEDGTLSGIVVKHSDGSQAGPILSLEAKGWAEQDSTTGKNLLPTTATSQTKNGITFTVNADGSVMANGTASAQAVLVVNSSISLNGTYTLSGCPSGGAFANGKYYVNSVLDGAWGASGRPYYDTGNSVTLTGSITAVAIVIDANATVNNLVFKPQLELGSTATEYEPYTGGAPSPSPSFPQEIRVCRGHEVTGETGRFVDLVVKQDNTTLSTTPIPLPSRGWVASLPDGTADTLMLDGAGKVTWERKTNETTQAVTDGVTGTVGVDVLSTTGQIADGATVLYKLATPITEDAGYIEMPEIPVGAEISIPELDDLGVDYIIPLPVVLQGYEDRIAALEAAIAELATS